MRNPYDARGDACLNPAGDGLESPPGTRRGAATGAAGRTTLPERKSGVMLVFRRKRREREVQREIERWIRDGTWPRDFQLEEVGGKNGFTENDGDPPPISWRPEAGEVSPPG